jgi:hypothetical protein
MIARAVTQARRQESQISCAEEESTRDCRAKYVTGVRETVLIGFRTVPLCAAT